MDNSTHLVNGFSHAKLTLFIVDRHKSRMRIAQTWHKSHKKCNKKQKRSAIWVKEEEKGQNM